MKDVDTPDGPRTAPGPSSGEPIKKVDVRDSNEGEKERTTD